MFSRRECQPASGPTCTVLPYGNFALVFLFQMATGFFFLLFSLHLQTFLPFFYLCTDEKKCHHGQERQHHLPPPPLLNHYTTTTTPTTTTTTHRLNTASRSPLSEMPRRWVTTPTSVPWSALTACSGGFQHHRWASRLQVLAVFSLPYRAAVVSSRGGGWTMEGSEGWVPYLNLTWAMGMQSSCRVKYEWRNLSSKSFLLSEMNVVRESITCLGVAMFVNS